MGEDIRPPFDLPAVARKKVSAAFDGGRITSDGGVMLLAQAERRLGIADLARVIPDERDAHRVIHPLPDMLRARIFAIACGYEDADDLDRLRRFPQVQQEQHDHADGVGLGLPACGGLQAVDGRLTAFCPFLTVPASKA